MSIGSSKSSKRIESPTVSLVVKNLRNALPKELINRVAKDLLANESNFKLVSQSISDSKQEFQQSQPLRSVPKQILYQKITKKNQP